MAQRRRSPKPIKDRLILIYETQVWPLDANGQPSADGPYEPTTTTIGFDADSVPADRLGERCRREALWTTLKADGWEKDEKEVGLATNTLHRLRFKHSKFIPAAQTKEAQRVLERSAR